MFKRRPRPLARKRRTYRRKARVARIPRAPRANQLSVQRTFWRQNWVPATTTVNDFWRFYSFQLGDLPSSTDFTTIFDSYRINGIKVVFRPRYDSFAGNDTTDTTLPGVSNQGMTKMHILVDPKSNTTPAGAYAFGTLNTLLENGSKVRTYTGNKDITVYFKPTVNRTIGGVAAGSRVNAPWLQTNSGTTIDHWGFHAFAQDVNFTGVFGQAWDVYVTYYMQFRDMKS